MRVEIIRGTVEHNHKAYAIGDVIKQISRADGERLIKKGAAVEYDEESENTGGSSEEKDPSTGTIIEDDNPENTGDGSGDAGGTKTPSEKDESEKTKNVDENEE